MKNRSRFHFMSFCFGLSAVNLCCFCVCSSLNLQPVRRRDQKVGHETRRSSTVAPCGLLLFYLRMSPGHSWDCSCVNHTPPWTPSSSSLVSCPQCALLLYFKLLFVVLGCCVRLGSSLIDKILPTGCYVKALSLRTVIVSCLFSVL